MDSMTVESSWEDLSRDLYEQGVTDGLPVVPPTPERVREMIGDYPEEMNIGSIPPRWGAGRIDKLAANAVMAGARPEFFPVIVSALKAMLVPQFNLYGIQATTHCVAPLTLVNGPVIDALDFNGKGNAFGPGSLANATVGRALRLILWNVGGGIPPDGDMACQGSPGKYSYCVAENQDETPWEPFHVRQGYDAETSTVTVYGGESPHNINDHENEEPEPLMDVIARTMTGLGQNSWYLTEAGKSDVFLALGPEHAHTLADGGWSVEDIQLYLYDAARLPFEVLERGGMYEMRDWAPWMDAVGGRDGSIPVVRRPEQIRVCVVGGAGKHSSYIPSIAVSHSVTRPVVGPEDDPLRF